MGRAAQIVGLCPSAPGTPSPQGLTQYRSSKEKKTAFAATLGEIANPGIQTGQLFTSPIPSTNGIGAKNADYRGGVTCLYDTQLLGACLHASEAGGRSRPEAVRGMPDVPIAPPATGPPEGWAAVGFVSRASFNRGLWARFLRVLGS